MADIYIDSCLIISLVEGSLERRALLSKYLFKNYIFSSELTRLEARVSAIRFGDEDGLREFESFFDACEIVKLDRPVFDRAALLRANTKLKTPDALHLAVAMEANCQEFWTDDKQLKSVASQYLSVVDYGMLEDKENSVGPANDG